MIEKIKNIIYESQSTLEDIKHDHILIAERLGIDISHYYSKRVIQDEIIKRITGAIDRTTDQSNQNIFFTRLKDIEKGLIYRYLLQDEPNLEYLNVLRTLFAIRNSNVQKIPSFEETETWKLIFSYIKDYQLISPHSFSVDPVKIREEYPQEFDRVEQIKTLKSLGCKVLKIDDDIEIDKIDLAIIKLDKLIKSVGGVTLAKHIFQSLSQNNYSTYFERYHLSRQGNNLGMFKSPQLPIAYLLNICVKHPTETNKLTKKASSEIEKLSTAIATGYYNVEHYNQWAHFFQTGETIIIFFTEIAVWDSLYSLTQIRPKLSLQILKDLFDEFDEEIFSKVTKANKAEYFAVIGEIFKIAENRNGPTTIYLSKICNKLKNIDREVIKNILDINSHTNRANGNYFQPSDIDKVDFPFKPLIKSNNTKFVLMDKSWCAPSIFEASSSIFRQSKFKDYDSLMGYALENLIYKWLNSHNISYTHGSYSVDGVEGECDLLIETTNAIILVEFKKKALTRKAKSGIDINLMIDLSDSILSSQIQCGRTEIILREKGEITLEHNNSTKTIFWRNRKIERVSLTQSDFGGFHDKTLITQFFKALLTHSYGIVNSQEKNILEKFAKLEEKQKIWRNQYEKLISLDSTLERNLFFNLSFVNLGQLLEIILLSTDNDSFYKKLTANKYVTAGTLDFYREYELAIGSSI